MTKRLFAVLRSALIAPIFISIWTWFLPRWFGGARAFEQPRLLGLSIATLGVLLLIACAWNFAWRGLGTPAPFDPPRRLVISGPYRFVRNPMYVGFGIALIGEAIVFPHAAPVILGMMLILWALVSVFVLVYEEPTLRRLFGVDYENYCRSVNRWIPRLRPFSSSS